MLDFHTRHVFLKQTTSLVCGRTTFFYQFESHQAASDLLPGNQCLLFWSGINESGSSLNTNSSPQQSLFMTGVV